MISGAVRYIYSQSLNPMNFEHLPWWGKRPHRIFTVIVFLILASLDNAARAVLPPLYAVISNDLNVSEASLGVVTAMSILVVAVTALMWGYLGDRGNRKQLLLWGTLIWTVFMYMTSLADTYSELLLYHLMTAVGIGCIASVGFSIVTDLISPQHRGLMMSFWGLSQAGGGGFGSLLGSMLGASNWRIPFVFTAGAGFVFAMLYFVSYEPRRGQSEPELAKVFEAGERYGRRIRRSDLRAILANRSNVWLILQGFMSTVAFGALVWMPRLYIGRLQSLGYDLETATVAGNLLSLIFQSGLYVAVLGGIIGDRWQRRNLAARSWLCTIGSWGCVPFLMILFLIPMPSFAIPADATRPEIAWATITNVFTNGWILLPFLVSLIGFGLMSLDVPNRSALLSELNQPEHRGTIAGLSTLLAGAGLAVGNGLTGIVLAWLSVEYAPPTNFAYGLILFQLFFIPAGMFYYLTTRTTPNDITCARQILSKRGQQTINERISDEQH